MDRLLERPGADEGQLKPFGAELLTPITAGDAVGGVACINTLSTQVDDVSIKNEEDGAALEPSRAYPEDVRLII